MAWKLKYRCRACGYEAEVYEGRGLFRQEDVAPSYRSEVGRLCLNCGSDRIRIWDKRTCPKCQERMELTGDKEFWT